MSVTHYESVFVVKATLTEEEAAKEINNIKSILENNGAKIASTKEIGIRELAYEVDKQKRGNYTICYFTAPTSAIAELERNYRINENVIKFITIKYENKREIAEWEKQSKGE
jgi:small subunit ribosomal protein S6